jgi:hypothetical protein
VVVVRARVVKLPLLAGVSHVAAEILIKNTDQLAPAIAACAIVISDDVPGVP